jgi:hypothetical protein
VDQALFPPDNLWHIAKEWVQREPVASGRFHHNLHKTQDGRGCCQAWRNRASCEINFVPVRHLRENIRAGAYAREPTTMEDHVWEEGVGAAITTVRALNGAINALPDVSDVGEDDPFRCGRVRCERGQTLVLVRVSVWVLVDS